MRCVVYNCPNDSRQPSRGLTYHTFPTEQLLRAEWITALNAEDWEPDEHSAVCCEHFLEEDFLVNSSGQRALRAGAVPVVNVRVCRICFATDSKLYMMRAYMTLSKAYESLTGLLVENEDKIPPYLCSECACQLQNCVRFRKSSLRAHLMLLNIVKYHGCVTLKSIQSIKLQSSLNLNQIPSELDIDLNERDNMYINEQTDIKHSSGSCVDVIVDSIKVERDDFINKDHRNAEDRMCDNLLQVTILSNNITTEGIKLEPNDTDGAMNEDATCISSLSDNIHNDVKTEDECVMDKNSYNVDSACGVMEDGDVIVGEDYYSDVGPLAETTQKAMLSTTVLQQVTKNPTDSPPVKVDTCQSPNLVSNNLSCDVCSYRTDKELYFLSHSKAHAADHCYSCDMCSYITINKKSLIRHAKVHLHHGEKPYSCDICRKAFTQKRSLNIHLKTHLSTHSVVKPHLCSICSRKFISKSSLTRHLKTHSGVKPYLCDKCSKSFHNKSDRSRHLRTHTSEESHPIDVSAQKSNFEIHLRMYSCDICSKSFNNKCDIIRHLRIHSGVKPYPCGVCNGSFNSKGNLTRHLRTHSGVKPYSCDICKKEFNQKVSLKTHIRTHSGEKPYSCETCNKSYSDKSNHRKHMKTHPELQKKDNIRCVVSKCDNDSSHTSKEISYHIFPTEPSLRAALHLRDWEPEEYNVCSEHFLKENFLMSTSGMRTLRADATPVVDVRVCRICFATECKLYTMRACRVLSKAYERLTGLMIENEDNIPPYLCSECVRQLQNCAQFKNTSLRAHLMLLDIVKRHGCVTLELIQPLKVQSSLSVNQTDCDLDMKPPMIDDLTDGEAYINYLPGSVEDVSLKSIKVDREDLINQDDRDAEDTINDNLHQISFFSEDIIAHGVKFENDGNVNTENLAYTSNLTKKVDNNINTENKHVMDVTSNNADSSSTDINNGDVFLEASQRWKRYTAVQQLMMEVPTDSPQAKVDRCQSSRLLCKKISGVKLPHKSDKHQFVTIKESNLAKHAKLKCSEKQYSCDGCYKSFKKKASLKEHSRTHSGDKPYSCNMCNKGFNMKSHLTIHLKTHSSMKKYSCDVCNKAFNQKGNLNKHLKTHSGEKPYSCNMCYKAFIQKGSLAQHLKTHSNKKEYSCNICNKGFNHNSSIVVHMRKHSGEKPYLCNVCFKSFHSKGQLSAHLKIHSNKKGYTCDICNKGFVHKGNIILHLRTHSGEKPYSCNICFKAYKRKANLTAHLSTHSGQKPYSCNACDRSFHLKCILTDHLKIHSGKKEYTCDICNKRYYRRRSLTAHLKIHSGRKKYSCNICSKEFIQKVSLTRHLMTHTGAKPYTCNICTKAFTDKYCLKKHIQTH